MDKDNLISRHEDSFNLKDGTEIKVFAEVYSQPLVGYEGFSFKGQSIQSVLIARDENKVPFHISLYPAQLTEKEIIEGVNSVKSDPEKFNNQGYGN